MTMILLTANETYCSTFYYHQKNSIRETFKKRKKNNSNLDLTFPSSIITNLF
jgi:hypothetical protein